MSSPPAGSPPRPWRPRPEDFAWLALFAALALAGPESSDAGIELLSALALLQVAEPRIPWFETRRGAVLSISLKLLLTYLLIGVTGGVTSSYYPILMVPVVAAATRLALLGTFLVTAIAGLGYLSQLALVDWSRYVLLETEVRELLLRVVLLFLLALLMHQLAAATRAQARQYQAAARDLAAANQRLQQAQDAVRRSERLAALGQLTAGLAHELRNPLGTMRASAEVLLRQLDANPNVARELAGYVRDEVDRINLLITRFLDFARPLEPRLAPTDINTLLDRAIAEVQRHASSNAILFVRNYSPDIEPIPADESLLERVFTNLLTNAVEASAHGATVTVKTRPLARGVEVAVIDRGHGIHPAQRENIFNPFFTTKASGVGLGLAIVSKIVDGHRGRLSVESEPGQGSVFRVWLPATEVS